MSHPLLGIKILFSRKEFSALTGLSLRTTANLLASGELRSIRIGRRRLISRIDLERFAKRSHPVHRFKRATSALHRKVGR
jgi:excisionase family DNA binding protein